QMISGDAIFILDGQGLRKVAYSRYLNEEDLQTLVERHPELIVGEQIDSQNPPRWLLVRREVGVPDGAAAADRWSLDHLLLDHRGVPTFVETKRSTDSRIRREVVGQMLDYAANATRYWPAETIRALAITQHGGEEELELRVRALLEGADEPDTV